MSTNHRWVFWRRTSLCSDHAPTYRHVLTSHSRRNAKGDKLVVQNHTVSHRGSWLGRFQDPFDENEGQSCISTSGKYDQNRYKKTQTDRTKSETGTTQARNDEDPPDDDAPPSSKKKGKAKSKKTTVKITESDEEGGTPLGGKSKKRKRPSIYADLEEEEKDDGATEETVQRPKKPVKRNKKVKGDDDE